MTPAERKAIALARTQTSLVKAEERFIPGIGWISSCAKQGLSLMQCTRLHTRAFLG